MDKDSSYDNLVNGMLENGLTPEEEKKVKIAFSAFDKDDSGYIDTEELTSVLGMLGQTYSDQEI